MPAAKSTAKPDGWTINPDGTMTVTIDGKDLALRRPKHGEQRRFDEALLKIQMLERAQSQREMDAFKGSIEDIAKIQTGDLAIPPDRLERLIKQSASVDPEEAAKYRYEIEDARVEWWATQVLPALSTDAPEFDADDLPNFFAGGQIINEARVGWAGNPSGPGGP